MWTAVVFILPEPAVIFKCLIPTMFYLSVSEDEREDMFLIEVIIVLPLKTKSLSAAFQLRLPSVFIAAG
ncbi:hypothetical protein Plhal710r2_c057g0166081 [Plasmopara halstedii]